MAPTKRHRATFDDDSDAGQSSDASGFQDGHTQAPRSKKAKRRKSDSVEAGERSDLEIGSQLELVKGDGNHDEERAETAIMQKMRASNNFKTWLEPDKPNKAAEYGIIEEIYCQNFMCHEKLRIPLGPNINFVIGHNGSGKSAVLTALVLCLGGKASDTNRGSKVKDLIRAGTDVAVLRVKIKNRGDLAYQPELYGDSIIVERSFTRAGASSFKIQNENGRTVATKKAALDDMLDYLSLQLDNPLNVLTQDLARQFLSASTPADKYKFFLKGTQLEQLDRDYKLMYDLIDQTEAQLQGQDEDMEVLKAQVEKAERKKRMLDEAGTIRDRIKQLEWMHAWAQVEAVENELEHATRQVTQAEADLEKKRGVAEEKADVYATRDTHLQAAVEIKADYEAQLRTAAEAYDTVKAEFESNRESLLRVIGDTRKIQEDLSSAKDDVKKQEAKLAEHARLESSRGPEQERITAELRDAELEQEDCKQRYDGMSRTSLDQAKLHAEEAVQAAKEAMKPATQTLEQAKSRLLSLQNERPDPLNGFHRDMARLLKAIDHETRFKEKPVGPMGLHVRLKKPEWSSQIESTFGAVLNAFVVTNVQDQAVMRELQQRFGIHSDVYIGDKRPLDVSQNAADPSQDTLLSVLDVKHDLVRNQIIINQSAEQIVLIKDRREAHDYLYSDPKPRNTKAVLCINAQSSNEGHRFTGSLHAARFDRIRPYTGPARMQTDIEAQIQNQKYIVNEATERFETEQRGVRELESRLKKAEADLKEYNSRKLQAKVALQEAEAKVIELKEEMSTYEVDSGAREALLEALREARETEQQHSRSYTDAVEEKQRLNELQRAIKPRMDLALAEKEEADQKLEKAKLKIQEHSTARELALREKNLAFQTVAEAQDEVTRLEATQQVKHGQVEAMVGEASKICARVPVDAGLTPDAIDTRIDTLVAEVRLVERNAGGDMQKIMEEYHTTKTKYNRARAELTNVQRLNKKMKMSYLQRTQRWREFRQHIMAKAKIMFSLLLNERAFKGNLKVNHDTRELDIVVEPDATVASDKGRQAKTLSGGEKSFSTICLLLSIWEAMGSPIRCLDEFDVFMDNVNRDRSMRMMIQAARRAAGKQYILITPQAMGNVDLDRDVKVIKMSDPERGQTALAF